MKPIRSFLRRRWHLIAAALLGLAAFLCVFGLEPLRVTGIGWTQQGFYGKDIRSHQAGWMFFRNSPWTFPLCKALFLGWPEGTSVSYTDSIPIAALFFKLLSPLLPASFQYFGLWTCFCFMMQGIFGAALVFRMTRDRLYSALASILFVMSSSFLERCFRHTALSSHWLVLAALYLYFREEKARRYLYWGLLLCLAVGIHPYLFGMAFAVFAFAVIRDLAGGRAFRKLLTAAACAAAPILFGYLLGLFGTGVSGSGGFGIYSLNLNALFNPLSKYHDTWSAFLKTRPIYGNQCDGIYYLGLPMLGCLVLTGIILLRRRGKALLKDLIRGNRLLLVLLGLCTLFALSNVITFDDHRLIEIPLPALIYRFCSIFRSSERFFFPAYYCINLLTLTGLHGLFPDSRRRVTAAAVILLAALQIFEILPGLKDLHRYFAERKEEVRFSEAWDMIAEKYDTALTIDRNEDRRLAFWLAKNGFRTNVMVTAPVHREAYWDRTQPERDALRADLEDGSLEPDPHTIYIITDKLDYEPTFETHEEMDAYVNRLRTNYEGKARLEFLTVNPIGDYWILCPNQD